MGSNESRRFKKSGVRTLQGRVNAGDKRTSQTEAWGKTHTHTHTHTHPAAKVAAKHALHPPECRGHTHTQTITHQPPPPHPPNHHPLTVWDKNLGEGGWEENRTGLNYRLSRMSVRLKKKKNHCAEREPACSAEAVYIGWRGR